MLKIQDYNVTCDDIKSEDGEETDYNGVASYCYKGIKISLIENQKIEGTESSKIKYEITTGATWNLGALNKILVLGGKKEDSEEKINNTWLITGEAVVIMK